MLNWLRGLMNGDQSSVPDNAHVTRDALGRVVRVQQTLSPPVQREPQGVPTLVLGPELEALLPAACDWIADQNQSLARQYGVGLETSFLFDQEDGTLTLAFKGGRKLVARAQVLGSFDPSDRSFLWGWANASLQPGLTRAVAALRDQPPAAGDNVFATPRHQVSFDNLTALLALAGQTIGADGLYRAIGDSLSLFLAIHIAPEADKRAGVDATMADAAVTLVDAYDAEMLPVDRAYADDSDDDGKTTDLIDRKSEVYGRYWRRGDDYWAPSSLSWPSDHDPSLHQRRFVAPSDDEGLLCVTIAHNSVQTVYHLQQIEGALRIVDQRIDWGDGLLWPSASGVEK
ncbi:DUF6882 domain-containing protein [Sphingomonas sp. ASY06-1R]|uniref:DUF6882 domain-containing protein n=1 Tax=Sphingomonas sp. ASY06-1R TaxID=3445771 RepID=UPI003FA1C09A